MIFSDRIAHTFTRLWFSEEASTFGAFFTQFWLRFLLTPLAWVFGVFTSCRRWAYNKGFFAQTVLPVPVIVIGNITVGGTGKTPLLIFLAQALKARGFSPAVISRGYGGSAHRVQEVTENALPSEVGDEPFLIRQKTGQPVFVGKNRSLVAKALLNAYPACDLILSDDGLQHYPLARTFEIAVFDDRGIGNGALLPAGPLREPLSRLSKTDLVIWNGTHPQTFFESLPVFVMQMRPAAFYRLGAASFTCEAGDFRGKKLLALAGIGHPKRFFDTLSAQGLSFETRAYPDHHAYAPADFEGLSDVLLMTEKDAVKCAPFADCLPEAWVLPIEARFETEDAEQALLDALIRLIPQA